MNKYSEKLADGRYVYYSWDDTAKAEVPHYLVPGENGVTEELIVTLDAFDREEASVEDSHNKHADYSYRNYLARIERGDGEAQNPIDANVSKKWWAAPEPQEYADRVELVRSLLDSLTEDQVNLIYEIFGERHTQVEVAKRLGRGPTAINNRLAKIKNRMKKLLAERGFVL